MSTTPTPSTTSATSFAAPTVGHVAKITPAAAPHPQIHDAAQQARNLRQVLQEDKLRVGCFLGAGCPLGIYDEAGTKSIVLIPAVVALTKKVAGELGKIDSLPGATSQYASQWDKLIAECNASGGNPPTVEDVLTEVRALANRKGTAEVNGMKKSDLTSLDEQVCKLIAAEMGRALPQYRNSYTRFASWLGGIQRTSPVEIFTPNYDLLFEQALENHPLPHFDGFVGSREPWFDLSSIEHDTVPTRWTRLWKLHGSINWERIDDPASPKSPSRVVRVTREAAPGKVMIFPSHLKYDQSRRMPYLAMLDRLRAFFRAKDAPRIVVCGYSFLDEHLNEVLLDGLRGNQNAHCFALMFSRLESHSQVVGYAQKQSNLTVLASDGAVVGTRIGRYKTGTSGGSEQLPWLIEEARVASDPATLEPLCRLGDFHFFGLFLEQLCGDRGDAKPVA